MSSLPEILAPLAILGTARRKAEDYFAPLLDSPDEVLQIGAWSALLDRCEIRFDQYDAVVALAGQRAGIRSRAYAYFMKFWEYAHAARIAAIPSVSLEAAEQRLMQEQLTADLAAIGAALRELYLEDGNTATLLRLLVHEEQAGGWRRALPVAVNAVILNPHDPMIALDLLSQVHDSRQVELVEAVIGLFEANNLHPSHVVLYGAAAKLMKGNPGGCIKSLTALSTMRISRADVAARLRAVALQLTAEALERLQDYRKAYNAYREMNAVDLAPPIDLGEFRTITLRAAEMDVPPLPPDPHDNYFIMTGFPRSGTTLLENALAAHPLIETFEEIQADSAMHVYLDRMRPALRAGAEKQPIYLEGRRRYYEEMDRLRRKDGATLFVDKMPMRSADAVFNAKLFPAKRYIFSIRHPFDVVLSCFKQRFAPNVAMEHFRTFDNAAKLYDFTMSQWFSVFSFDDPRVHYVRYDTLVTEFEPTVRAALDFLGAGWDDAVLGFASAAESRPTRTPSYHKVRQGLGIGVQSSWRNYEFLFQSEAAQPLRKWVEHFGYHIG